MRVVAALGGNALLERGEKPGRILPGAPPLESWLSARQRSRQPEPGEHAGLKAGHGADPVAGQGEDRWIAPG